MAHKKTGLQHLLNSTLYSLKGLKAAFKHEAAFRQECVLACILIPLAFYLASNKYDLILLVGSILLIFMAELLNSAIEAIVDRVSLEQHELSGRAKDLGSACVFIAIIIAIFTWLIILIY